MKSTEQSFGAKLRKAQDGLQAIQQFVNYSPPRVQESADQMNEFLITIASLNDTIAIRQENYNLAVNIRQKSVETDVYSLKKLPALIRANINALYGTSSFEAKQVAAIIRKIRGVRLQKAPTVINSEEALIKASSSQSSYGALTKTFKDLIITVAQFPGYTSNKPILTIQGLNDQFALFSQNNDNVAASLQSLSVTKTERAQAYLQLGESMLRIKNYCKVEYGIQSQEYKGLKQFGW